MAAQNPCNDENAENDDPNSNGHLGFDEFKTWKDVSWMDCAYLNSKELDENGKRMYKYP